MTRAEKVAQAQTLRAQGLTYREIGTAMGVSMQTAHGYLNDPDGAKMRAYQTQQAFPCGGCGEPTRGLQSPGGKLCWRCVNAEDVRREVDGTLSIPLRFDGAIIAWTRIDARDAHVARHRWRRNSSGYAVRTARGNKSIFLHRVILGLGTVSADGLIGDHINRDRLDNRRANLRVVTVRENSQNRSGNRRSASPYRGVGWDAVNQQWIAYAQVDGVNHWLGRFVDEDEAASAARSFRVKHMPASFEGVDVASAH